ncbi:hypothetical protein GF108_20560 [Phyllobacterium sp. SYP-B3895]|uniref:hypothetical protein n=1 Tax=Phyllobacterium sp. SYP-B3895 TaxID=2663240 RepID=UPI001299A064|nr:hypothetical protein [Phyllobacterium sp. SYP-B3895]MRG57962.1 hypothetical protein [Phyllobacterium sp. SYP-B3895]
MSRINRRAFFLNSGGAIIASTVAGRAPATASTDRDLPLSRDLQALIAAHKAMYAAFQKTIRSSHDHESASRAEEKALLAVCAYPAVGEADRKAKARYLLEIEARGELDLAEQMQALLRSTMWEDKTG